MTMRRTLLALMATAGLLSAANAEKIDLSTMTCAKFQASAGDEVKLILTWLDAYYRDEKDPPVIDTELFVANAKKLGEYCSANPTIGLITATDKLFQK
jgi:acid stress chaperone HdeB